MRAPRCLIPLLAIATGAGCFSDKGAVLRIDVSAAPGTTEVELFITNDQCGDPACDAVKPKDEPLMSGQVWLRYDTQSRFQAKVEGHIATFHLETDKQTVLSKVIAIGSSSAGVTGVLEIDTFTVPSNDSKVVDASLLKAGEIDVAGNADRGHIWTTTDQTRSCGVIAHVDSTGASVPIFVVPSDNKDCDSVDDNDDCTPTEYETLGALTDASTCLYQSSVTDPCILGAAGCIKKSDPRVCAPLPNPTCVPSTVCSACLHTGPFGQCRPMLATLSRLMCDVATQVQGNCNARDDVVIPMLTDDCGTAAISLYTDGDEVETLQFKAEAMIGNAKIDVDMETGPCALRITRKGDDVTATVGDPVKALIKISTEHGNTVFPILLNFNLPCTGKGVTCHPTPDMLSFTNDSMWDCTK